MTRDQKKLWASGICIAAALTFAGRARADRNDILVALHPGNAVTVTLGGLSGVVTLHDGTVSMQTDQPFCVGTATTPCTYSVNAIKLQLNDFTEHTNVGTFTLSQPYALIRGPLSLTDSGNGLTIPVGTNTEIGAVVTGPHVPTQLKVNTTPVSQALTVSLSAPDGTLTIDGTIPFSFFVSEIDQQFDGSISGLIGGEAPFVNTAPIAHVGPALHVVCPQTLTLDGTKSVDRENNIALFTWTLSGSVAEPSAFGPTPGAFFAEGVTNVTLDVFDTFGARSEAQTSVTVTLPPPTISASPTATLQSCSTGSSAVAITVPTAQVCGATVAVTGTVTSFNGASSSIPVTAGGTIDVPPGSGTVRWVATNHDGVSTAVTQSITVLSPATLLGLNGVEIDDGSAVQGTIYAGGGGTTLLEPDARLTQVFSLSPVSVRDRVTAALIDTNAAITFSNAGTDHIAATSSAPPILPVFPNVATTFTGTTPEVVNPTPEPGSVVSLAPGQYGNVTVFSRGKLILSKGTYAFRSLDLEPQATIVAPSASSEAVQVFVESSVIYRGSTVDSTGAPAPLFLAYLGTNALDIGTPFTGTIVAPNAPLGLQSLNGQGAYTGEFFARQITVSPHDTVISNPFTCGH